MWVRSRGIAQIGSKGESRVHCEALARGFLRPSEHPSQPDTHSDQIVVIGVGRGCRHRIQIKLRKDIAEVTGYRLFADVELSRDAPIGHARCDQSEYLQFPVCKWACGVVGIFGQETFYAGKLDRCTQLLKRLSGGSEFQERMFFI